MSLRRDQQEFIDEFSRIDAAMPRAMGLILGYLLVCEPAEQASAAMQQELGLSAGSVSTMLAMLVDSGLVSRVKKPGERKYYYVVVEGSWQRTVEMRLYSIKKVRDIAAKGMHISDNYRMREIWRVYDTLADDLELLVRRLDERTKTGL